MDVAANLFTGRVLFVCSAVRKGRCTEAVAEQSRGLKKRGVRVSFFQLEKGGFAGYVKEIFRLRRFLKQHEFEVIHAHYGLSAVVASLAGARSLVVSLMGSDVFGPLWLLWLGRFFSAFFWPCVIVKSQQMANRLGVRSVKVIPNGVDLTIFREIPREEARIKMGCSCRKVVLWPANPDREVKNVKLALDTSKLLVPEQVELKIIYDVPTRQMPWFYNSAEVVLVTSRWEGSPNVVKEALACNVPVVSTPVGDVEMWLQQVDGCEVVAPEAHELADAIRRVIGRGKRINGRAVIGQLDIDRISARLMNEYLAVSLTTHGRTAKIR
ncbi:glycosyltransferase family 4 protein [Marinilabilia salmonicolor]|jgi:glycosyltransferase involved in cell wall biosynthesis|uniref:Glycosyltransferase involved in cell wall biosynthesis n=1 Tax=Marinilabilia salmonicolor TaxID=989 RepID=A0A368V8N6_9BACT|nr:glycosyltransferase family 4 protein [Marinilabilia salmonicolor]RCW37577.1 glycosyltransferase involved in cell wall biosynthesis [Marinilabilia salmonicolor]